MESVIFGDSYSDFDHNLPVIFKNALLQNLLIPTVQANKTLPTSLFTDFMFTYLDMLVTLSQTMSSVNQLQYIP